MQEVPKALTFALFKKKVIITSKPRVVYPQNSVACIMLPENQADRKTFDNKNIGFYTASSMFNDFHVDGQAEILFTHLGGGIGDVIAFSAVADYLDEYSLNVYVDRKYFPIFKWFSNSRINLKGYSDIVATNYTFDGRAFRYTKYGRLRIEYAAVEAGSVNWYDAFFQRIGLPEAPTGFDRPRLRIMPGTKSDIPDKRSIMISHRSSCQMRSSSFEDFYIPVREAYPKHQLFVHEVDLSDDDKKFIEAQSPEVDIIPRVSISQYMDNLYAAELVVCTDTSAIHFREGVGKPCVAAFAAMTADSRTRGYRFTHSFNIKSKCPYQPCFVHELIKGQHCPNYSHGETTAKCQSGDSFREQLFNELQQTKL